MLKIGIFGVGYLGKIHIQQWLKIPGIQLVGIFDPHEDRALQMSLTFNIPIFKDEDELIAASDALDIVATTINHFYLAQKCFLASKHVFIEKPLAGNIQQSQELVKLYEEAGVKCQLGHVERYNPAFKAVENQIHQPAFIEAHRLAEFNPRGTDVAIVLDLMIHDLDIILHVVNAPVKKVSASGVAVISHTFDIANARLEFENGCVANITASRISLTKMRKLRIFQKDAFIGMDFLHKQAEIIKLQDFDAPIKGKGFPIETPFGEKKNITIDLPEIEENNAILEELKDFVNAIVFDKRTNVSIYDGLSAMEVAYKIMDNIEVQKIN